MIKKKLIFRCKSVIRIIMSLSVITINFNPALKAFAINNTFEYDDFSYTIISEEYSEVCVTKYNKNNADVVIESKVNYNDQEYDVVAFERKLFKNKITLKNIVLPSSITFISTEMFSGCSNLRTIKDSNGKLLFEGGFLNLDTIGKKAFKNCIRLFEDKEVEISLSDLQIGFKAFENTGAKSIHLSGNNVIFEELS